MVKCIERRYLASIQLKLEETSFYLSSVVTKCSLWEYSLKRSPFTIWLHTNAPLPVSLRRSIDTNQKYICTRLRAGLSWLFSCCCFREQNVILKTTQNRTIFRKTAEFVANTR